MEQNNMRTTLETPSNILPKKVLSSESVVIAFFITAILASLWYKDYYQTKQLDDQRQAEENRIQALAVAKLEAGLTEGIIGCVKSSDGKISVQFQIDAKENWNSYKTTNNLSCEPYVSSNLFGYVVWDASNPNIGSPYADNVLISASIDAQPLEQIATDKDEYLYKSVPIKEQNTYLNLRGAKSLVVNGQDVGIPNATWELIGDSIFIQYINGEVAY